MASSSNSYATNSTAMPQPPVTYGSDGATTNTTFVQADPSTFRTIVQKLTGVSDDPSAPKLPVTHPARPIATSPSSASASNIGHKRPTFKLHERRQAARKLEIKLNHNNNNNNNNHVHNDGYELCFYKQRGSFLVSPVSTLEFLARMSPRSPREEFYARESPSREFCEEEEEKAIAEKGFYLHPSPLSTPRGGAEPELLPLFPLTSPRNNDTDNSSH